MNFKDNTEEAAFREEVRDFIKNEIKPDVKAASWRRRGMYRGAFERLKGLREKLSKRGWIAPAWPKEYGGAGLYVMQQFIMNEEFAENRVPPVGGMGVVDGRPDDHHARQRGPEEGAPQPHPLRRGAVVPGVQRARLRLGPRVAADARGEGRRRLRDQRPEDLDVGRVSTRTGCS